MTKLMKTMCQEFAVTKRKAMNDVGKRFCNGQFLTELSKRVFHEQGHHEVINVSHYSVC